MPPLTCLPLEGIGDIGPDSHLERELLRAMAAWQGPRPGDLLVVAHKVVSKAEGRVRALCDVRPTPRAEEIARQTGKDPALVQLILEESREVTVAERGILMCRHRLGWTCANAGIDQSNTPGDGDVVLLPSDPDRSARQLSDAIHREMGVRLAVIVSDTHGRALRQGILGVAVGSWGIAPLHSYVGECDLAGRAMEVSVEAVADELAAAASLLMGQGAEGIPAVLVRGYPYRFEPCGSDALKRNKEQELFEAKGKNYNV